MLAISNKELKRKKSLSSSGKISCKRCGKKHVVMYGKMAGKESRLLGFVTCGKETYLATINEKVI